MLILKIKIVLMLKCKNGDIVLCKRKYINDSIELILCKIEKDDFVFLKNVYSCKFSIDNLISSEVPKINMYYYTTKNRKLLIEKTQCDI